jgi:hypothetical protein
MQNGLREARTFTACTGLTVTDGALILVELLAAGDIGRRKLVDCTLASALSAQTEGRASAKSGEENCEQDSVHNPLRLSRRIRN